MSSNNSVEDLVHKVCDETSQNGVPDKKITSRNIANSDDIPWSHAHIAPHITSWHKKRKDERDRQIIALQTSPELADALRIEINIRVNELRKGDEAEILRVNNEMDDFRFTLLDHEKTISKLRVELDGNIAYAAGIEFQLGQAMQNLVDAETLHCAQLTAIGAANKLAKDETTKKISELEEKLKVAESEVQTLKSSEADLNYKNSHLETRLNDALLDLDKKEVKLKDANLTIQNRDKLITNGAQELNALTTSLATCTVSLKDQTLLDEEINALKRANNGLYKKNQNLNSRLGTKRETLETQANALKDAISQRDRAQTDLSTKDNQNRELQQQLTEMANELNALKVTMASQPAPAPAPDTDTDKE